MAVVESQVNKVKAELERVSKSSNSIKDNVTKAVAKVEKYIWLGKKHGLNF
jgi:hypothetical protein